MAHLKKLALKTSALKTMAVTSVMLMALSAPAFALDREDVGTVLGALGGGLLGNQFGAGSGNIWATGAGVFAGTLLGRSVGGSLDKVENSGRGGSYGPAAHYQQQVYQQQNWYEPAYAQPVYQQPVYQQVYHRPTYQRPVQHRTVYVQPTQVVYAPEPNYGQSADHNGRFCREFTADVRIGQNIQRSFGTACLAPDGSWQIQP